MSLSNSISKMTSSLSSFSSTLGGAWEGRSGQHLVELCTNELQPKIVELQGKADNYEAAVAIAGEIDKHNANISTYEGSISQIDSTDEKKAGMISHYRNLISKEQQEIDTLKQQVRGLLG